ncbi:DUF4169 family protein [Paracoccus sp. T5]|uniref:DUF4169 family protein n=1 Tax=Paracoccus sp. T5 TaxID=3402161 RepID=UPI003AE8235D
MTTIVNLRQARKQRDRDARRATADANAARHGETKALRQLREAEADLASRRLDGHRAAPDGSDD